MECVVEKDAFTRGVATIKKLSGNNQSVGIITDTESGTVDLVVMGSYYVRYKVPAKDIKKGSCVLDSGVLTSLGNMRKKDLTLSFSGKKLTISGGAKAELDCKDEDLVFDIPTLDGKIDKIKIGSKEVAELKNLLGLIKFSMIYTPYAEHGVPIFITSNEKRITLSASDASHCVFVESKIQIADKPFSFSVQLDAFKNTLSCITTKASMFYSNSALVINSPQVVVCMPFLQEASAINENAEKLIKDKSIFEEVGKSLTFAHSEFVNLIDSATIVSQTQSRESIFITVKEKGSLHGEMKTDSGKASLDIACKSDGKNIEAKLPLLHLNDVLGSCSSAKEVMLFFDKKQGKYKLVAHKDKNKIQCIAPCYQEA